MKYIQIGYTPSFPVFILPICFFLDYIEQTHIWRVYHLLIGKEHNIAGNPGIGKKERWARIWQKSSYAQGDTVEKQLLYCYLTNEFQRCDQQQRCRSFAWKIQVFLLESSLPEDFLTSAKRKCYPQSNYKKNSFSYSYSAIPNKEEIETIHNIYKFNIYIMNLALLPY